MSRFLQAVVLLRSNTLSHLSPCAQTYTCNARNAPHTGRFYCSCVKSRRAHTQTSRRRVTALIQFYECANIIVSVCADSFFDLCSRLMACHYFATCQWKGPWMPKLEMWGFRIIYIFVRKCGIRLTISRDSCATFLSKRRRQSCLKLPS